SRRVLLLLLVCVPRRLVDVCLVFFLLIRRPPRSTLFPYTTLFRSRLALVALEVFFRGPIVRLESVEVGTPFQVVTQLVGERFPGDRKSTRLNSSHVAISYAVFCLKKKKKRLTRPYATE